MLLGSGARFRLLLMFGARRLAPFGSLMNTLLGRRQRRHSRLEFLDAVFAVGRFAAVNFVLRTAFVRLVVELIGFAARSLWHGLLLLRWRRRWRLLRAEFPFLIKDLLHVVLAEGCVMDCGSAGRLLVVHEAVAVLPFGSLPCRSLERLAGPTETDVPRVQVDFVRRPVSYVKRRCLHGDRQLVEQSVRRWNVFRVVRADQMPPAVLHERVGKLAQSFVR